MVEDSLRDSIAEIGLALRREANCKWDDKKRGEKKKKKEKNRGKLLR